MNSYVNGLEIVTGDGGPMIVLQVGAVPLWQGADDWDNALMNGGTVETDYDVICETGEHVIHRYDRDMLVLDDAEWGACLVALPFGEVAVLQCFGWREEPVSDTIKRLRQNAPSQERDFDVRDTGLRLLVGATPGTRDFAFGVRAEASQEFPVTVGTKHCAVYETDDALLFVLSDKAAPM